MSPSSEIESDPEGGIVCTDSDLTSLLTATKDQPMTNQRSPKLSRASSTRRSITQKLLTADFLTQEAMGIDRMNREELFERRLRRISTGSMNNNANDQNKNKSASNRGQERSQLRRRNSLSWDHEKELTVDPALIGSVIEDLLKGRGGQIQKQDEQEEQQQQPQKDDSVKSIRKGSIKQIRR